MQATSGKNKRRAAKRACPPRAPVGAWAMNRSLSKWDEPDICMWGLHTPTSDRWHYDKSGVCGAYDLRNQYANNEWNMLRDHSLNEDSVQASVLLRRPRNPHGGRNTARRTAIFFASVFSQSGHSAIVRAGHRAGNAVPKGKIEMREPPGWAVRKSLQPVALAAAVVVRMVVGLSLAVGFASAADAELRSARR